MKGAEAGCAFWMIVVCVSRVSPRDRAGGGGGGAFMVSIMVVVSRSPRTELRLRWEPAREPPREASRRITRAGTTCSSSISGRTLIMHIFVAFFFSEGGVSFLLEVR